MDIKSIPAISTRNLYLHTLLCLCFLNGCRSEMTFQEKEKEQVIQEVKNTLHNYVQDVEARGLNAEFVYLDSSADFFWWPPGFSEALRFDSVASILRKLAPGFELVKNRFESLEIRALSPDLATYTASIHSVMKDHFGKADTSRVEEQGALIRRDKSWKLLFGRTRLLP